MKTFALITCVLLVCASLVTASPETDVKAAELYASLTNKVSCDCPTSGECNCGPACDCVGGIQQISSNQTSDQLTYAQGECANGQCGAPSRSYSTTTYGSSTYSSSTSVSSGGQCGLFGGRRPIRAFFGRFCGKCR